MYAEFVPDIYGRATLVTHRPRDRDAAVCRERGLCVGEASCDATASNLRRDEPHARARMDDVSAQVARDWLRARKMGVTLVARAYRACGALGGRVRACFLGDRLGDCHGGDEEIETDSIGDDDVLRFI